MRHLPPWLAQGLTSGALTAALVGGGLWGWGRLQPGPQPQLGTLVAQVSEVARLETLEVRLHKKIAYSATPAPASGAWAQLTTWAQQALAPAHGRLIVFAIARVGLDVAALADGGLRLEGDTAVVALPPLHTRVELLPDETEVIGSNLDTAQTAELLQAAKNAFLLEVGRDPGLAARARGSAERAIRGVLMGAGIRAVRFVDGPPPPNQPP